MITKPKFMLFNKVLGSSEFNPSMHPIHPMNNNRAVPMSSAKKIEIFCIKEDFMSNGKNFFFNLDNITAYRFKKFM